MLNSRLILIEGLPGAGKSSTTVYLGAVLEQAGSTCRCFQEEDNPHPIPCLDFEIKDLTPRMVQLWDSFARQAIQESSVTIIESRLWQNTALFMYMSEKNVEDILDFSQQVAQALAPLSPVLIYLDQANVEAAMRQLYTTRGEKRMQCDVGEIAQYAWFRSRGLNDFAGWVHFFKAWRPVAGQLFDEWPYLKIIIQNPHADWIAAYKKMREFLHISSDPLE